MSLAIVYSRAQCGIDAPLVTVEVHLSNGLPGLSIVGLPETAVKESKDRVRAAILNSRYDFPQRRITINLAPADLPKEGGRYDLPIALGILAASSQLDTPRLHEYEFVGELALSGDLRPVHGVLPVTVRTRQAGRKLIVPLDNAGEAGLVTDADVFGAGHVLDVCAHLNGTQPLPSCHGTARPQHGQQPDDLRDVRGQPHAKRALTIAAAGGHSLLMIGPPGTGKTMLACRLPGILPPMTEQEAIESASIASISQHGWSCDEWGKRPFRSPHHTASAVALVGGGSQPRPGEISLAHNGVLFLDELPEFDRRVLEVLREPMESGMIHISRAAQQAVFPARFQLVTAMNPCPCGHLGDVNGGCRCTQEQVQRYRARISGPLLDRIDMHIEIPRLPHSLLSARDDKDATRSEAIRQQVIAARHCQYERSGRINQVLTIEDIRSHCRLDQQCHTLLESACNRLGLSARAYHRILKVARTIADLDQQLNITDKHLAEAIGYRRLDRPLLSS